MNNINAYVINLKCLPYIENFKNSLHNLILNIFNIHDAVAPLIILSPQIREKEVSSGKHRNGRYG